MDKNKRLENGTKAILDEDFLEVFREQINIMRKTLELFAQSKRTPQSSNAGNKLHIRLTKSEIKSLPVTINNILKGSDYLIPYRITSNGYYEARLRKKEIKVEASGVDYETMRIRFVDRLLGRTNRDGNAGIPKSKGHKKLFDEYGAEWLRIKAHTTKPSTYNEYLRSYTVDLADRFHGRAIEEITRRELQDFLLNIVDEGKNRKAEKLALILSGIFSLAADDIGIPSPMNKVVLPFYQSKHGKALSKDEETQLVEYCLSHKEIEGTDAILVLLHFGLRKSELKSIKIVSEQWLECETSKQRMGLDVVFRKIPFTPRSKKVIPYIDFEKASKTNLRTISSRIKRILPNHHAHELRTTFITRCKECGVHTEVVMMWSGHSEDKDVLASRVNRGYTDFSDEFQLNEAEKVTY